MSSINSSSVDSNKNRISNINVVLDLVDAAIITIDESGSILEINPATERLFKYTEKEMLGENVNMLMPTPYKEEHDQYLENHNRTGKANIIGVGRQVTGLRADKSTFPMHLAIGKHNVNGKTLFTGIIHDLTYQTERTENSTRLGQILNESLNEIYMFDGDSLLITMINRGALKNLGYSKEEALKMTPLDISIEHSRESFKLLLEPLIKKTKQRITFQSSHQRKDGTSYDVDVSISLSNLSDAYTEFVAIVDDVTEKNRMLKVMHQSQKLESVGQLTGGIAHDFNNLLTVISGNLELLEPVLSTPVHADILKDARDAADMGARLTSRLLAFASRSSLTPHSISINQLILDMLELLSRTIGDNISLVTDLSNDIWVTKVDISQLENSLLNLVINARDAMPDGGQLSITTSNCTISSLEHASPQSIPGDFVKIVVSDTGQGISQEDISLIFEPFYTTKKEKHGSGLGLSMVYGFVRQSGGFVEVESDEKIGTAFTLYIPRDVFTFNENLTRHADSQNTTEASKVILLVEDEDRVLKLTRRRLERLGHSVIEASDGYEALELFKRTEGIDIIFSDMVMTAGMSGYDLAKAVLAIQPNISFLLTSGYSNELIESEKLEKLDIPLLRKPYTMDDLKRSLSELQSTKSNRQL